jgi:hypothetical protein
MRSGSASPLGFDTVLLAAVTTCLMGGIALAGGRGNIIGIAIGLFTLRFFITGVASLGAPYWAQNLATGGFLILVIAGQVMPALLCRDARASGAAPQGQFDCCRPEGSSAGAHRSPLRFQECCTGIHEIPAIGILSGLLCRDGG